MPEIGIADKTTLDAVNTKIGATGDAANATGSIFARFAEMLTNRLTAARAAKLDNLDLSMSALANKAAGGGTPVIGAGMLALNNNTLTALSVSNSGVLDLFCNSDMGTSGNIDLIVTVDGVQRFNNFMISGESNFPGISLQNIKFNTSLLIQVASTITVNIEYNYCLRTGV